MARPVESPIPISGGYVVPMPRATDALGRSLRQVFGRPAPLGEIGDLLNRLDAIN